VDQGLLKLVSAPSARGGGGGGGGGEVKLPPQSCLSSGLLDSVVEVQEEKEKDERGAEELEEELRHRMAALALALASCPNTTGPLDADPPIRGAVDSRAPRAHDSSCSGARCVPFFFLFFYSSASLAHDSSGAHCAPIFFVLLLPFFFLLFVLLLPLAVGFSRSLMVLLLPHAPTQWSVGVKHALPRLREKDARRCC
jgi:hypothetical protein